jgi:hypothetical protein
VIELCRARARPIGLYRGGGLYAGFLPAVVNELGALSKKPPTSTSTCTDATKRYLYGSDVEGG